MGDLNADGPGAQGELTVAQARALVARLRRRLAEVAEQAAGLDARCVQVPATHLPNGEQVLVSDLVQTSVPDPQALARQLGEVAELGERLAAAVAGVRQYVAEQCGPFAPEQGWTDHSPPGQRVVLGGESPGN